MLVVDVVKIAGIELYFIANRDKHYVTVEVRKSHFVHPIIKFHFFSLEECEYIAENGPTEMLKEAAITAMRVW